MHRVNMTDGVNVRPAVADDLASVLALDRATPEAPHWPEPEYRDRLAPEEGVLVRRVLLVAELTGRIAGYAAARILGEQAELESIAVVASLRRQGIANALGQAVLAWCAGQGAKELDLEVRASSTGAQRLYTGLGFAAIGRRIAYYSAPVEDAVLMRRKISILDPPRVLSNDCGPRLR